MKTISKNEIIFGMYIKNYCIAKSKIMEEDIPVAPDANNNLVYYHCCAFIENGLTPLNDLQQYPLHKAAQVGHLECMKILIDSGIDPNQKGGITNIRPLHLAVAHSLESVDYLIHRGADINETDSCGNTPFHMTFRNKHINECVKFFIEKGGDPYAKNICGYTPLCFFHETKRKELEEIIQMFGELSEADKDPGCE